jgi:hypothetical protein
VNKSLTLIIALYKARRYLEEAIRIEHPFLRRWLRQNDVRILGRNFPLRKLLIQTVASMNPICADGLGKP